MIRRAAVRACLVLTCAIVLGATAAAARDVDVFDRVRHAYADADGVRIHYAALGRRGPLIVMIHGFPDCWYSWREQMPALSRRWRVVAIDQRGYNLSDKPKGVERYDLLVLANDVAAVIRAAGAEKAVIVGHDWGGAVAWTFAITHPEMTDRLVILNSPHPRGLLRELRENPQQRANSEYARVFQQEGAHLLLSPEGLAGLFAPDVRDRYLEAFRRSDLEAMLNYYKRNYPREPYADVPLPPVQAPVLVIHGLDDPFLLAAGLGGTWDWVTQAATIVTVPGAGHFVQHDAPEVVTRTIVQWLGDPSPRR